MTLFLYLTLNQSLVGLASDLSTVESNLISHRYTTLGEFVKDVTKIFDNCRYYNPSSSQFYRCAETLEVYFVDKLKALRDKLKI